MKLMKFLMLLSALLLSSSTKAADSRPLNKANRDRKNSLRTENDDQIEAKRIVLDKTIKESKTAVDDPRLLDEQL